MVVDKVLNTVPVVTVLTSRLLRSLVHLGSLISLDGLYHPLWYISSTHLSGTEWILWYTWAPTYLVRVVHWVLIALLNHLSATIDSSLWYRSLWYTHIRYTKSSNQFWYNPYSDAVPGLNFGTTQVWCIRHLH